MRRILVASITLLSACASAAPPSGTSEPESVRIVSGTGSVTSITRTSTRAADQATFAASRQELWRLLPAIYDSLAIPVARRDENAMIIGNPNFRARRQLGRVPLRRYFDCGSTQGGANADTYELNLTIMSEVKDAGSDKAMVATTIDVLARPVNFAGDWFRCSSTSALEERIVELIRAHLAGAGRDGA